MESITNMLANFKVTQEKFRFEDLEEELTLDKKINEIEFSDSEEIEFSDSDLDDEYKE